MAYLFDQGRHGRIGFNLVGKHRQQPVAKVADAGTAHLKIHDTQKFAIAASVGDQRFPASVGHRYGHWHAVVRVPAQNGIYPAHPRGHFQIYVHAVVR